MTYHEYKTSTGELVRRHYNGQRLSDPCWPHTNERAEISNPDSSYWRSEAYLMIYAFDKLPMSQEDWDSFRNYFEAWLNDIRTWKEVHGVYEQALQDYRVGMSMDELAYRSDILPDDCRCVLPEQSCKYCRIAAKVVAEAEVEK